MTTLRFLALCAKGTIFTILLGAGCSKTPPDQTHEHPQPPDLTPNITIQQGLPYYGPQLNTSGKVPYKGPVISISAVSLPNFGYISLNTTSGEKEYIVQGDRLIGNISVAAPPGFEVSIVGPNSGSPLPPLVPIGGKVPPTHILVRFKPTQAQAYSGNVSNSSPSAMTQDVSVNGWSCADIFFEPITDLPGDCYISNTSDISSDGDRVVAYSYAYDPAVPTSGGNCTPTSSGDHYGHPYQAAGWTSKCKNILLFPASPSAGLIGLGYLPGAHHSESAAFGISPDGIEVVGYSTFGTVQPDQTRGVIFTSGGIVALDWLTGDKMSFAYEVSQDSPLPLPAFLPPGTPRRVIVGYSYTEPNEPSKVPGAHAVYWDNLNNSSPNHIHALPLPAQLPNGFAVISSEATCVSDDGTLIGGNLYYNKVSLGHFNSIPCLWRLGSSTVTVDALDDVTGGEENARIMHVSGDGRWLVGWGIPSTENYTACRWNANAGLPNWRKPQELAFLAGTTSSYASGVSQDGSIIVGGCSNLIAGEYIGYATLWKNGTVGLPPVVHDIAGILHDNGVTLPDGWTSPGAIRVSANGRIIVGIANHPNPLNPTDPTDPSQEGWVAGIP